MPKRKQEPTVEDRKTQIKSAFNAIEESDKLRDRKAAEVSSMKMDIADLLKEVIQKQLRKDYDPEVNARVIVNPERGDFEVYIMREVVEEVDLPTIQISYEEARQIDDSLELGDFYEEGPIDLKKYLTRKSIQIIKQAVQKKVRDAERDAIFEECREKVGKIVSAEVYQIRPKEIIFTYNTSKNQKVDLILPMSEKMPKDNPRKTPRMKLYVKKVEREKIRVRQPDGTEIEKEREDGPIRVIVSRTDDNFLRRLFEAEVPEISEGLIIIKGIARVPGERAKVAVESTSNRIDPVGACVGHKGKRIQNIVRELGNENIDVVSYSDEPQIYIARALQPAKIDPMSVFADFKNKKARVMLKPDQIKYAIGKNGNNIHLAEKLTGFEIEIYRELDKALQDSDDIDIIAFREEFGDDMIYQLLDNNLDTARKALEAGVDAIERALLLSPKRDDLFADSKRTKANTRIISEEERKYWRRIAENIYKTLKDEFEHEAGDAHLEQHQERAETAHHATTDSETETETTAADTASSQAQPKPDDATV